MNPIVDAICSTEASVQAKEIAAPLVEAYIERFKDDPQRFAFLAAECPWYLWLDDDTLLVGAMDGIRKSKETGKVEGLELKTRRAPRIRKDGQPYVGDREEDWAAELSQGPQLAVYALAMKHGTFVDKECNTLGMRNFSVSQPRIRVRAAIKSTPPVIWPTADDGLFEFGERQMEWTTNWLLHSASAIRAHRSLNIIPWQGRGPWCRQFNRDCDYLPVCREGSNPTTDRRGEISSDDPGSDAVEAGKRANPKHDPSRLVVLSASSYSNWATCAELWRLNSGGYFEQEPNINLETGKVFHAGIEAWHRMNMGVDIQK